MALTVEQLQVVISAQADQFNRELAKVQGNLVALDSTSKKISGSLGDNLFGSMVQANVIGNILTGTIARMTRGMGSLTSSIVEGGAMFTRLKIANETIAANLGITRDQLKGLRDDLADANTYGINAENVIRTLALSGLVEMSKSLEAVDARSGETVKGVTALTLAMKDLAAANAIDSSVGIERLSKFIQRGEATFADGLIELSNLNDEYRRFGSEVGKTVQQLTAQEKAQARMNIIMREADKVFGAYANTYQTAGKAFGSIRDISKSITQMIGSSLEPILRVAGNGILQFFVGIRNSIGQTEGSIRSFANKVAGYMVALIRVVGKILMLLPGVGKNFEALANFAVKPIQMASGLQKGMSGASGAMDDAAGAAKKLKGELAGLSGFDEMNVLTQSVGTGGSGASEAATGAIGGGGGGGGDFDFEDSSSEINAYADNVTEKIDKVASVFDKLTKPLRNIKIFGTPLLTIFSKIIKYAGIIGLVVGVAAKVFGILAAIMGAITSPIALVLGLLGGLAVAFVGLYENSEPFREALDQIAVIVQDGLVAAWESLIEVMEYLWTNVMEPMFAWIEENIAPSFEGIMVKVGELIAVFQENFPLLQAAIQPLVDAISKALAGSFRFLGEVIDWLWKNILKPLVDFILANIVPAFTVAIEVLRVVIQVFSEVAAFILGTIQPTMQTLWDTFTTVFEGVRDIVEFVWGKILQPIFTAFYDLITKLVIPVIQALWGFFQIGFNAIRTIVEDAWEGILTAIKPALDWIDQNVMPVINGIRDGFETAWDGVKKGVDSAWNGIASGIKGAINGVIDLLNGFVDGANNILNGIDDVSELIGVNVDFRIGKIPRLAKGGIINSPTYAQIGEAGTEAVLPLENNTEGIEMIANAITEAGGAGGGQPLIIKLGEETIFEQFVDFINEGSVASNKRLLNI